MYNDGAFFFFFFKLKEILAPTLSVGEGEGGGDEVEDDGKASTITHFIRHIVPVLGTT